MNLLALSVIFVLAAPPPERCTPADLACTARAAAREAADAKDVGERAEARLTAARAHLGLYRKTGAQSHLCEARRFVTGVRQSDALGDLLPATRDEIKAELSRLGITCPARSHRPTPKPASSPAAPEAAPLEPITPSPPQGSVQASPVAPAGSSPESTSRPVPEVRDELLPVDTRGRAALKTTRPPVRVMQPANTRTGRSDAPPPAGRGLLIAGGVLVGGASIAGGLAALAGIRADRLADEQNTIASATHAQGFSTPDMTRDSESLAAGVAHWDRVMLGAALSCAALGSTAIALMAGGAVKRRRGTRVAMTPGPGALLFTARF